MDTAIQDTNPFVRMPTFTSGKIWSSVSINRMKDFGHSFSLSRVIRLTFTTSIAFILVMTGGMEGFVQYQTYLINVIMLVIFGLGWLAWFFMKRIPFPSTPFDLPIIVFFTALLASTIYSHDPRHSIEFFFYYLIFGVLFYSFVVMQRMYQWIDRAIPMILIAGTLCIVLGFFEIAIWYFEWLKIGGLAHPVPPFTIRIKSIMGHANYLAAYLNLLLPLGIVRISRSSSRGRRVWIAIWCLAILVLLFFTSSRGGWLGTGAALGSLILLMGLDHKPDILMFWNWLKNHKLLLIVLLSVGIIIIGVLFYLLILQSQHPSHPSKDPRGYIWSVAIGMFRDSPILGKGPGMYGTSFLKTYSIPPSVLMPHAHNLFLNTLGESGLIAASAGIWFGITALWITVRRWNTSLPGTRSYLAGSLAALFGLLIHSQLDFPQVTPIINLITIMLLAQIVSPFEINTKIRQVIGKPIMSITWVALGIFYIWSAWGYTLFYRGLIAANENDLVSAKRLIDKSVLWDPQLAYYHFQSGLLHTEVALDDFYQLRDKKEIDIAILEYEKGLSIDGANSLNWACLAELRWKLGNQSGGIGAMEQAVNLASSSPELNLELGRMLEEAGHGERALQYYQRVLELNPEYAKSPFYSGTEVRKEALSKMISPFPAPGWKELEIGDYPGAEKQFRQQLGRNNADAYLGLGISLLNQEKFTEAKQALHTADMISGYYDPRIAEAFWMLYERTGNQDLADISRNSFDKLNNLKYINYKLTYNRSGEEDIFILDPLTEFSRIGY